MSHEPVRHANTLIFPAALDPDAVATVKRLIDAGLEAYLVGGCVRDLLLGVIPKDFDVSTEARPRQIRRVFRNSRIIGRRFKLAHIHWPNGKIIEVATFRATPEGSGEPGVATEDLLITRDNEFGNAEEDVLRRDFTINALLYDVRTNEVIDYVGGFQDLQNRVLRTIGDPATRFAEDPVRMLRAMKFLARLDLQPTPEVAAAMSASSELIARSSPPRVLEEIYKLMACGKARRALPLLVEHGLLQRLLPEVAPYWSEHTDQLAAVGEALDRVDRGRRRVPNDQLLAVLCLGPWLARLEQPVSDPLLVAHDLFDHAALRMSIPRRDMAALRQVLITFSRLLNPLRPRSRRFRMGDFLDRPITRQAVELLYIAAQAGLTDPEAHAHWAQRLAELPETAPSRGPRDEEEESEDSELRDPREGGRRRRHRGGRRRRGRGRDRGSEQSVEQGEDRPFGPQPQIGVDDAAAEPALEPDVEPAMSGGDAANGTERSAQDGAGQDFGEPRRRGRRRRGRRGRGRSRGLDGAGAQGPESGDFAPGEATAEAAGDARGEAAPHAEGDVEQAGAPEGPRREDAGREGGAREGARREDGGREGGGRRGRRRRRGGRGRNQGQQGQQQGQQQQAQDQQPRQQQGQGQQQRQGQQQGQQQRQGQRQGQQQNQQKQQQGQSQGRGRRGERRQRQEDRPKDDKPAQGPGQRNPEDVEDFFDW